MYRINLRSMINLVHRAFRRKPLREPLYISAVVINHIVLLHPSQSLQTGGVKLLPHPSVISRRAGRGTRRPHASITVEVPKWCGEWRLGPIGLHKPAPRGPVISIPQARVDLHRLVLRVWHASRLSVLELSNGCPIRIEANMIETKGSVRNQNRLKEKSIKEIICCTGLLDKFTRYV